MDFIITLALALTLFGLSTTSQAQPKHEPQSGVAFVHGTRDHRDDADGRYWKRDYVASVTQGLKNPDNYVIVACDFNQYMWHEDAGHCVATQLLKFIEEKHIDSLTVITHSDGGNVVRWILSNPTFDGNYLKVKRHIKQVIALAPSSDGTVLADEAWAGGVFQSGVSWLLGYLSDAVKQQRIGDMIIYNDELLLGSKGRPELPVPFRVVVGTDVYASPFDKGSYCNSYLLNSGLLVTKLFLKGCSDGFLNCESQASAGTVWFYDTEKTEGQRHLSHNQSRHSCFGMDNILASALAEEGAQS